MSTGDDTRHSRPTSRFDASDLARLTREEVVTVAVDEVEDAFSEWEELSMASGSQPAAVLVASRTETRSDPLTTGVLAEVTRRASAPAAAPAAIVAEGSAAHRPSEAAEAALPESLPSPPPRLRRTMEIAAASLEEALRAAAGEDITGDDDAPAPPTRAAR